MPELKLENVSYQYKHGDRKVVNEVTCLFKGGKLNSVLGPSGSGKTTLLSIMAGLDQPTQGQIYIDGESLADLDLDQYRRERVSMIFQAFHLFPLLTVLENVCFPMQLNGVSRQEIPEKAKSLLSSEGITEEKFKRYPANLSGGEQQRVAIARALVTRPQLVLADEPTANLDSVTGQNILDLMRELNHADGTTFIFSTHDARVMSYANAVIRLADGKLSDSTEGARATAAEVAEMGHLSAGASQP